VLPLLATTSFPFLAAAGATFLSVIILGSPETPITLSALAVLLYAVGHLVARRGLLLAVPLVVPFFLNAFVPFDGGDVDLASIGPFVLVATAALAGESSRKRIEAVTALDATQAAMAATVQEQTAMEERATIARELHDIVAHHLSVIAVQSETARLTSPRLSKEHASASRQSARRRGTRSPRPVGYSGFCGRTSTATRSEHRNRVSSGWRSSWTRLATPGRTFG
jgi:signal transduction histidine kinase